MDKGGIIMFLGLLLIVLSIFIVFIGFDTEVIGETSCVDGLNRLNLEGIMCEDKVNMWFGLPGPFCLLILIPAIIGLIIVTVGLNFPKGEQDALTRGKNE